MSGCIYVTGHSIGGDINYQPLYVLRHKGSLENQGLW